MNPNSNISLGILAAGRGQRWGGRDKGLIPVAGQLLIAGIVQAFESDVAEVIINCRRHPHVYRQYGQRIVGDALHEVGPTAGVAALLASCQTPLLLVLPCDVIGPSKALLARMLAQLNAADAGVVITDDKGRHSACALLRTDLGDATWGYIASGRRSLRGLFEHLALKPLVNAPLRDVDAPEALRALTRTPGTD